jgi:hypothetical protein
MPVLQPQQVRQLHGELAIQPSAALRRDLLPEARGKVGGHDLAALRSMRK